MKPCRSDCPQGDCANCVDFSRERPTPARAGVRSLEQLRQRCRVDEITGCWIWAGAMSVPSNRDCKPTTRVWLPDDSRPGRGSLTTAGRAAWILAGKPIKPGQVVYRVSCHDHECINPGHARAGSRSEMGAHLSASGIHKGSPKRAATNMASTLRMTTPVEVVRQVEALLAAGVMCKDIRVQLGIANNTMTAIKQGRHVHCASRQKLIRGASVFALGGRSFQAPTTRTGASS